MRLANFRGSGKDGFPTGSELMHLVARARGENMPNVGTEAAELMGMAPEPAY